MLGKLIKHEFKATYKTYCILFAAILVLAAFVKLSLEFELYAITTFSVLFYVIAIFSSFVVVLVFTIRRFYRSLLSNQAYLTLMLPATAHQHLFAKIIPTAVWYIGLILTAFLSLLIIFDTALISTMREIIPYITMIFSASMEAIGLDGGLLLFHLIAVLICMAMYQLMVLYFCTTIGGQSGSHKRLFGIAIYFAFYFGLNIVSSVVSSTLMNADTLTTPESLGSMLNIWFIITEVLYLGIAVACYFGTTRRLTHNFNLQ